MQESGAVHRQLTGDVNPFRQSLKANLPNDPEMELDQHLTSIAPTPNKWKLRLRSGMLAVTYGFVCLSQQQFISNA